MNLINYDYKGSQISFEKDKDVMVNLTSMAKPFPEKNLTQIINSQEINDYCISLSKLQNYSLADLLIVRRGGNNNGTWAHRLVAIRVAQKLNSDFAVWVDMRIDELMKYGMTATPQTIDNILADPDNAIKILTALKEERKKVALLQDQNHVYQSENRRLLNVKHEQEKIIEVQASKVEYADNVLLSTSTYSTTQIAKELGLSACKLNKLLHENGVQYRQGGQWFLYEKYQDKGYMKTKTYTYDKKDGRIGTMLTSVWTEAGRMFIHSLAGSGNDTLPFR